MAIDDLIRFSGFLDRFRKVERILYSNKTDRNENDVEHSYMLALLAWYVCSSEGLTLDMEKVIGYALVHDMVEVYAGDTFFYSTDRTAIESKHAREADALKKIETEFPEFPKLSKTISAYEKREDDESKFVYALDKIQPVLMVYLDGGRSWKRDGITFDMLLEKKAGKLSMSPAVERYWNELVALLEKHQKELFPSVPVAPLE